MPDATAVTSMNFGDFWVLAPEIALTALGLLVLIVDFAALRRQPASRRGPMLGVLTLAGGVGILAYLLWPMISGQSVDLSADPDPYLFLGTIASDALTHSLNIVLVLLLGMVVALSMAWNFTEHWGEYFALLCWSTVGMMLLIASEELLTLFLTLETMTICLYLATSFEKSRRRSAEGGLKYFVYGSVSSALFLFGLSLIYGLTGTTRLDAIAKVLGGNAGAVGLSGNVAGALALLLVMVGFGFKIAAVPFHQWAPDAYEGAPAPVSAWIASGSKIASVVALMKVLLHGLAPWSERVGVLDSPGWVGVIALIAAASMTFGNLAALAQKNLKRMLAYSSIAHAGYLLVGVLAASVSVRRDEAAGSVLFYLVVYGLTTVGAFGVAAWLARDKDRDDIDDLNGLGFRSPVLAVCIVILMLSLIGMPPLAGFFGKLYMFMESMRTPDRLRPMMVGLVALGLLNSVISAFYYVRVLKAMFLRPQTGPPLPEAPIGVRWPILLATAAAVFFGVRPDTLLEPMRAAAIPMLSAATPTANRYATRADPAFKIDPKAEKAKQAEMRKRLVGAGAGGSPPSGASGRHRRDASKGAEKKANPGARSEAEGDPAAETGKDRAPGA